MMTTWTRQSALEALTECNGGFKAGTCRDDDKWYVKHHLEDLRQFIIEQTSFLDADISFHERMLYYKMDLREQRMCPFCKIRRCLLCVGVMQFQRSCCEVDCRKQAKASASRQMHADMSDVKRVEKNTKIGIANSRPWCEKFDVEKSNQLKAQIAERNRTRVISDAEKRKRIETRHKNGQPWHTPDAKARISSSNKKTHNSLEFREQHREVYDAARSKISFKMRQNILNGNERILS